MEGAGHTRPFLNTRQSPRVTNYFHRPHHWHTRTYRAYLCFSVRFERSAPFCYHAHRLNPADGFYSAKTMRNSGGWGEDVTDDEIVDAIKLLAETEGIFAETAGGVTLGTAKKLIEQGRINKDESIVICVTGNGLKTQEALHGKLGEPPVIEANLDAFDSIVENDGDKIAVKD